MADEKMKKIMLVAFLGGIWPRNPFMVRLVRKMPMTLQELMDKANGFFNIGVMPVEINMPSHRVQHI